MNNYKFDDIYIGLEHGFCVSITNDMLSSFEFITGDCNPLHVDDDFAIERGFKGRVAYGLLVSSFYSTLAGVYLPGKNALIHSINVNFLKPSYVGDEIFIHGKVVEKNETFRFIIIKATVKNTSNVKVSSAKIQVGIME